MQEHCNLSRSGFGILIWLSPLFQKHKNHSCVGFCPAAAVPGLQHPDAAETHMTQRQGGHHSRCVPISTERIVFNASQHDTDIIEHHESRTAEQSMSWPILELLVGAKNKINEEAVKWKGRGREPTTNFSLSPEAEPGYLRPRKSR